MRRFQLHLAANGAHVPTLNHAVAALRFFFRVTLRRSDIVEHTTFLHEPRKLPVVLSAEEVARLLDAAPGLKYKAALSVAYGAGLRAAEVISLKVSDIDSKRMIIRVEQGKGRKDRYVMLSPHLLELLRAWWKTARPQGWLFPGAIRVQPMTTRQLNRACHAAAQIGRDQQARVAAHLAAQLRHPSSGAEHRYQGDPGPARKGDILPANNRLKHASLTDFILASARRWTLGGGLSEAAPRFSLCTNLTAPLPAFRRG